MSSAEKIGVLCFVLIFSSPGLTAHAAPRELCTVPADCTAETMHVRFGNPADRNSSIVARKGEEITLLVTIDVVNARVQGWSIGLKHDPAKLQFIEATHQAPEIPITPAEFFFPVTSVAAGNPAPGFISAVVLAAFPVPGVVLPVRSNFPVCKARYKVLADLDPGIPSSIEFTDTLNPPNSPAARVTLTVDGKTRRPAAVTDGDVFGPGSISLPFLRGDGNVNGRIGISDAVLTILALFKGPVHVSCEDALDSNDDGSLDISDAVYTLQHIMHCSA